MYSITRSELWFNSIGIGCCVFIIAIYFLVIKKQYSYFKEKSYRLQVLSTRAAMSLPVYSIVMMLSLIYPQAFYALKVPVAVFEGYSFYCFFALIIENLGGPNRTVQILSSNGRSLCCSFCCPADKAAFYVRTVSSEWHFVFTRTAVILLSTIMYYHHQKLAFILLQVVAFFILANGILSILNLYENVIQECSNINGIKKFFVLKFAIGLMVVQGFFVEFLIATKKQHIHHVLKSTINYSSEERAVRIFCKYFLHSTKQSIYYKF